MRCRTQGPYRYADTARVMNIYLVTKFTVPSRISFLNILFNKLGNLCIPYLLMGNGYITHSKKVLDVSLYTHDHCPCANPGKSFLFTHVWFSTDRTDAERATPFLIILGYIVWRNIVSKYRCRLVTYFCGFFCDDVSQHHLLTIYNNYNRKILSIIRNLNLQTWTDIRLVMRMRNIMHFLYFWM